MLKNTLAIGICMSSLLSVTGIAMAYQSNYDNVQWEKRGSDTLYCIDITDENWNIYPGYQAIACDEDLYHFSPRLYVQEVLKINLKPEQIKGITFLWRVWSPSGYGGTGFEGKVTIGSDCGLPHHSDAESVLQWDCRFDDTFGSAEWQHGDENGSVTWTDDEGNGSAEWEHGEKCGSVEWSYESGSVNWQHDDECSVNE